MGFLSSWQPGAQKPVGLRNQPESIGFGILRGRKVYVLVNKSRNRIAFAALLFESCWKMEFQRNKQVLCGGRCFDDFQIAVVINIEKIGRYLLFMDTICFTNRMWFDVFGTVIRCVQVVFSPWSPPPLRIQ